MDGEPYQRASKIDVVRGATLPAGRSLSWGELQLLFAACKADRTLAGRRDAAILAVLYGCGLRRSEAAAIELSDYDPAAGSLTIRGKGRKERLVYPSNGGKTAIDHWIAIRGNSPGLLFGIGAQAIYYALQRRARQAGVAAFSPHDLRRTFVGDLLEAGADVSMVQQLAGHEQVTTTQRYDRRPEQAKRRAAAMIYVPFDGA
jgi:site-specific recombinase XerD